MGDAAEITVAGVPLPQFAFMRAGLAEGLALEELLGFLQLDPAVWELAEGPWDERVLDAVEAVDAEFLDRIDVKMGEARANWTRRVPPLDEDLRAWFAFVQALQNVPEPVDFLRRMGLGTADTAYLHRLWSERMLRDEKLREQALAMMDEDFGEAPLPAPEPPRLKRSSEAAPRGANATLEFALRKGEPLPFAKGEAAPMPPPLSVPLPQHPRPRATAPGVEQTAVLRRVPGGPPLPFEPAEAVLAAPPGAEAPRPVLEPAHAPIEVSSSAPLGAAPVASLVLAPDDDVANGEALPASPASPDVLAIAPRRAAQQWTLRVETIDASPFDEDPATEDAPSSRGGDTAPLQSDVSGEPLPFAPAARTVALIAAGPEPTAAIEVATSIIRPLASAFGPIPRLTLEQHAQLYAELTTAPEQAAEIRERYSLTPETQKAEDDFWHTELARDPARRAAWLRALGAARMQPSKGEEAQ